MNGEKEEQGKYVFHCCTLGKSLSTWTSLVCDCFVLALWFKLRGMACSACQILAPAEIFSSLPKVWKHIKPLIYTFSSLM